jgi:hypothetical protein
MIQVSELLKRENKEIRNKTTVRISHIRCGKKIRTEIISLFQLHSLSVRLGEENPKNEAAMYLPSIVSDDAAASHKCMVM